MIGGKNLAQALEEFEVSVNKEKKNEFIMTADSFRIGTQPPKKKRLSPNDNLQVKSNSPFRSTTNQSGKNSMKNSVRNMGESFVSKHSKRSRSKSRSPTESQKTEKSYLDRYCEK